ncbi:unnamed protein product, partial [Gongylonema pulchrum]|uniref:Translation initiation factor IF-2 n=1 Tax=Gongylonema pulchrum TaxID=637853 RepID=A0A183D824_9BILA
MENSSQIFPALIKDIESFDKKQLSSSNVDALAAALDLQPVDVWRCLNSLIQLRDYVNSNK